MIHKKHILEMVRHIVKRGQGYTDQREMHPMREWTVGIAVSTLTFAILAVYAGYTFYFYYEGMERTSTFEDSPVIYDQKRVEAVLSRYAEKQRAFVELRMDKSNAALIVPPASEELSNAELADEGDEQ